MYEISPVYGQLNRFRGIQVKLNDLSFFLCVGRESIIEKQLQSSP